MYLGSGFLSFLLVLTLSCVSAEQSTHIVLMTEKTPLSFEGKTTWYNSLLKTVSESAQLMYQYEHAINGFAVQLSTEGAQSLRAQPGVLSVIPEVSYTMQTTRTPVFLGVDSSQGFQHDGRVRDIVIGIIDSGVWPESKSFQDTGLGPLPRKWRGECEEGTSFTTTLCNRKLVGARYFPRGYEMAHGPINETTNYRSPRDKFGHGTHTSSIAAGSVVSGASSRGYAAGVAHGIAAEARIAVYKVCWDGGYSFSSDILAVMDKAIEDQVDILSLSLGSSNLEYDKDAVAIGALTATAKGIFVSVAAGNSGPSEASVSNVAPWLTTIGAGTVDRDFPAVAILGNGKTYTGVSSLFEVKGGLTEKLLPLVVYGEEGNVTGKIVLMDLNMRAGEWERSGALGNIYASTALDGDELVAQYSPFPAIAVNKRLGDEIKMYALSDPNPMATIKFTGTIVDVKPAPMVAGFSSRGPNPITPEILKPDLIAPGLNILGAWTGADLELPGLEFKIDSGTSMSCPHVSGLAALLKAAHPGWSPAAIRSALMTTAKISGNDGKPILDITTRTPSTPFAHGAGHVSLVSALNPGLIYDINAQDYLAFLCASNYTSSQIRTVARQEFTCDPNKEYKISHLNYPSFAVRVSKRGGNVYKFKRVVTSVGGAATYTFKAFSDLNALQISVEPAVLVFHKLNEKKSYTVTFSVNTPLPAGTNTFGSIEWSGGGQVVRSPVAITWTS